LDSESTTREGKITPSHATAIVSLSALRENVRTFKSLIPSTCQLMCVVKGNAYGHGLVPVSLAALEAGGDRLGVATAQESLKLCCHGIQAPIHILVPILPEEAEEIVKHDNIIPTVCSIELANALDAAGARKHRAVRIHVKVDTGMNRFGVRLPDLTSFLTYVSELGHLQVEGIFTHYSTAHARDSTNTWRQFRLFQDAMNLVRRLEITPMFHAANTAATLQFPSMHLDMVRIGLGLCGVQEGSAMESPTKLRKVMSLVSRVVQIKNLEMGDAVGYDMTYVAERARRMAIVSAGYVDGVGRALANRGMLLLRGKRVPIIGKVNMDSCMIDITNVPDAQIGDQVTIIGNQGSLMLTVEEKAMELGLSINEQWLHIGERVPRLYVE